MTAYVKPGVYDISDKDARTLLAVTKSKNKSRQRLVDFEQKDTLGLAAARLRKFDFESRLTP